jgi:hypothetical protein
MSTFSLPSLASQNGYTVIARHKMDWGKFHDSNHIYQVLGQQAFIDNLGLVTPFNQYGLVNTPILNMINVKKSSLYLDNVEGKFRFQMPYKRGLPYIVDTYYTNTIEKPGLDGARFIIKLSEAYTNGDVISTDLRNSPSLVVTEEEVVYEQDGYLHVVEVASQNRKNTYYSKKWLKPGSQFIKIDQAIDEYSSQGSSVTSQRLGWLELEANLGSGEKKVEHWITLQGSIMALAANDKLKSKINGQYDLTALGSILAFFNKDIRTGKTLPGTGSWLATLDAMVMSELYNMNEMSYMWGKGGEVRVSGRKNVKLSLGVYEQLRTGNRITYSRGKLNLDLIDSAIANLYRGTGIPVEDRRTTLDCGSGFLNEMSKLIKLEATSKNIGIINSDQLDIVSGKDPMNLAFGFRFTSYRFPNGGLVTFRLNQALDTEYGLRNTDRLYGEYPDYSYSAFILDVTDAKASNAAMKFEKNDIRNATDWNKDSNFYLVKPRAATEDYWGYIPGTVSPFGLSKSKGFMSASNRPGYGMFAYNFGNVWVKDPSRTLLIEIDELTF